MMICAKSFALEVFGLSHEAEDLAAARTTVHAYQVLWMLLANTRN